MTRFAVERAASTILVGSQPPHPERTALVEARGAFLLWDVLAPSPHPAAVIHNHAQAAEWLWEIYGLEASSAILTSADTVETRSDTAEPASPTLTATRQLAHLRWAEAWWPASHAAAVPALPSGLLNAEIAWRTAAVEHLLDDESAVERALESIDLGAAPASPDLTVETQALTEALEVLAEDYGVVLRRTARHRPEDWALAAGGIAPGTLAVASGGGPVDWTLVPQGLVDAAAEATWSLGLRSGAPVLTVTVPAAPGATDLDLTARVGGVQVDLRLDPATGAFTGESEAPRSFLTTSAAERTTTVLAPGFASTTQDTDPEAEDRRAAIVAFALERLAAPDATLTERAAARGEA
ncbi:hypothetical protein [Glycomyces sp. NRRL B-16210]|uniref:hypothetical protein n=1 Tax=Glycomyces sp. NRRL B-16210 TaxID=1463821 RepID=UPI0004C13745|nr:hypothetical protein [Glycomyces sp. NRRL B-16210]